MIETWKQREKHKGGNNNHLLLPQLVISSVKMLIDLQHFLVCVCVRARVCVSDSLNYAFPFRD